MTDSQKKIYLAFPRGFCAGVRRALEIVDRVLDIYGPPVYVFNEIVHNDCVVNELRSRGVCFVDDLSSVPEGSPLVFSAHGVSALVEEEAARRGLKLTDATCPLVKKVHRKALAFQMDGCFVFLIGHCTHPEIRGTSGRLDPDRLMVVEKESDLDNLALAPETKTACLTQTTLSTGDCNRIMQRLKSLYPDMLGGGDICYATSNRQEAVGKLAERCDTIFIIGSEKSSNSNRLRECAEKSGSRSFLINDSSHIKDDILRDASSVGISAGASAPERLVEECVRFLEARGWVLAGEIRGAEENISFPLPGIMKQ